jgi:hypothetical protein
MEATKNLAEQTRQISAMAPDHRAVLTRIRAGDYRPWYNPVPAAPPPTLNEVAASAIA